MGCMVAIFLTSTESVVDGAGRYRLNGVVLRSIMTPRNQQIPMTWRLDTQKSLPLEYCNRSTTRSASYEQAYF